MNHPTQSPAAESVSLSDAAVAQAFRDVMNGPFDIDAIYFVNAVNARARELDALRKTGEAGGGDAAKVMDALLLKLYDVAREHNDRSCEYDVCKAVRDAVSYIQQNAHPTTPPAVEGGDDNDVPVWHLIATAERLGAVKDEGEDGSFWTVGIDTFYAIEKEMREAVNAHQYAQCDATPPGEAVSGDQIVEANKMVSGETERTAKDSLVVGSPAVEVTDARDSARYRWLRDEGSWAVEVWPGLGSRLLCNFTGVTFDRIGPNSSDFDAAIDKATATAKRAG